MSLSDLGKIPNIVLKKVKATVSEPAAMLKSLSKKSGLSDKELEKVWNKAKKIADKSMKKTDPKYWGLVVSLVKKMIKENTPVKATELLSKLSLNEYGEPLDPNWKPLEDEIFKLIGKKVKFEEKKMTTDRLDVTTENLSHLLGDVKGLFPDVTVSLGGEFKGSAKKPKVKFKSMWWVNEPLNVPNTSTFSEGKENIEGVYYPNTDEWEFK